MFNGCASRLIDLSGEWPRSIWKIAPNEADREAEGGQIGEPGIWLFEGKMVEERLEGTWRLLGEDLFSLLGLDESQ